MKWTYTVPFFMRMVSLECSRPQLPKNSVKIGSLYSETCKSRTTWAWPVKKRRPWEIRFPTIPLSSKLAQYTSTWRPSLKCVFFNGWPLARGMTLSSIRNVDLVNINLIFLKKSCIKWRPECRVVSRESKHNLGMDEAGMERLSRIALFGAI